MPSIDAMTALELCFGHQAKEGGKAIFTPRDIEVIERSLLHLGTGFLKSALQKLIRYRSEHVSLSSFSHQSPPRLIRSDVVLVVVMAHLYNSSGQFNPSIGRWTCGAESLCKRLAITFFEDSCFSGPEDECMALSLLGMAFLCQRLPVWRPGKELLELVLRAGLRSQANERALAYETNREDDPFSVTARGSILGNCSALLDEIKSFSGDLAMVRYEARHGLKEIVLREVVFPPPMVFPQHAIDQHVMPSFIYFFPCDHVDRVLESGWLFFEPASHQDPASQSDSQSVFS